MARHEVGGGTQDWVFLTDAEGDASPRSAQVTAWDSQTAGSQYTDLQDLTDVAITHVESDTDGFYPRFRLPDGDPYGPAGAWIDANGGNGPRYWVDAHTIGQVQADQDTRISDLEDAQQFMTNTEPVVYYNTSSGSYPTRASVAGEGYGSPVLWSGPVAPVIGGDYAVDGLDFWRKVPS